VHPGLPAARAAYDPERFRSLLPRFALVGEVGLDRRAGRDEQARIFTDILGACRTNRSSSRCTPPAEPPRSLT
jgi:TatD DNase family protein